MPPKLLSPIVVLLTLTVLAQGQQRKNRNYPPKLEGAVVETYKTIGDTKLSIYIFQPKNHQPEDRRAAVVFFFGGGWRGGTPAQFHQHCLHLAKKGMVAMAADYRVSSRHRTKAVACVEDAKSAIRWVRQNADKLGVDPDRIAAAGGSAGGHIAACTGVIQGFESDQENRDFSSVPNAMVLFNPALVLAPVDGEKSLDQRRLRALGERMGVEPRKLSPFHNVRQGIPPTIIFHGKADTTVRFRTAELFSEAMKAAENDCLLIGYEGAGHGFFNYGRGDGSAYTKTVKEMDRFLAKNGFLEP